MTDRILLRLKISDEGKVNEAEVAKRLSKRKKA
jgi:hypothetical protein